MQQVSEPLLSRCVCMHMKKLMEISNVVCSYLCIQMKKVRVGDSLALAENSIHHVKGEELFYKKIEIT